MPTVAVFNQKGGSSKTTTTVHLAVAAVMAGHKVAVLDLDPQASAKKWKGSRDNKAGPAVVSVPFASLARAIEGAKADGYDFILIDSPPSISADTAKIVAAADLVLIPVRPQRFDMEAIPDTIKMVGANRYAFVLSDCPQRAPEIQTRRKELEAYGRPVFGPVHNWRSFWRALETGQAVAEFEPDGQPAKEIQALYESVLKELS